MPGVTDSGAEFADQPPTMAMPGWAGWTLVLLGAGSFVPDVIVSAPVRFLASLNISGLVLASFGVALLAGRVTVMGNTLVERGLIVSRTVALDRLSYVGALNVRGRVPRWKLRLSDQAGNQCDINFDGFPVATRTRVLAALAPWVKASGVRYDGPVESALAGNLWWPQDKERAREQKEWRRKVHSSRPRGTPGAHARR
jgi:hypothetical protein